MGCAASMLGGHAAHLTSQLCCRELGASGCKSLLAVPISFVSEHIETLEEIDMEYRELAHESGIQGWGRVPALNTNPTFIDDLANAVLEALPYAGSMAGSNPSDSMVPLGERRVPGSVAGSTKSRPVGEHYSALHDPSGWLCEGSFVRAGCWAFEGPVRLASCRLRKAC